MPTEQDEFTSVTITFKMTPEQRADYAREYGLDPGETFADLAGHLPDTVRDALCRTYLVNQFTTFSVAKPA
jgi:hypothetical protein